MPEALRSVGRYARGAERSQVVLRAALRLISRGGVAAITHRAVAREARVSLRATTYYFETKEDMIREALRFYVRENVRRADVAAESFPSRPDKLESAVEAIATVLIEELKNPELYLPAEYELVLAIAREPTYAPEYRELQRMLEVRLGALLAAIGSSEPATHARLVLAATRGLQVEQLANPRRRVSGKLVREQVRALVRALVPGSEGDAF